MADRSLLSPGKLLPALSLLLFATLPVSIAQPPAEAAMMGSPSHHLARANRAVSRKRSLGRVTPLGKRNNRPTTKLARNTASKKIARANKRGAKHKAAQVHHVAKAIPPQLYLEKLNQLTLKPGVVYKYCHGGLNVNVVEVDTTRADVKVRPYLASESFDRLKTVEQHAKDSGALVAVNANYFKKDGTPLGTIKVDGEWVAGSLFDRVAMGITNDGDMQFARVNLHGILNTSNPKVPQLWVNNMNQPRRSGARLILYTRRWGDHVRLAYEGTLVAVSNRGEVVDTNNRVLTVPYGGYVLTDRKQSELASLKRGDFVDLEWQTNPRNWNQVAHAVSGGPTLIKDGNLWVGLKEERFRPNWTSSRITRRTACGVTKDKKLILATVEGPHTLWDLAKFLHQLGCVEAMNLDGGGSTTMVVDGKTVTRNDTTEQRKVAATITVMEPGVALRHKRNPDAYYRPTTNLQDFSVGSDFLSQVPSMSGLLQARQQQHMLAQMTFAGDELGAFLGIDQSLAPATSLKAFSSEDAPVIDIDNDLVQAPKPSPLRADVKTQSETKTPLRLTEPAQPAMTPVPESAQVPPEQSKETPPKKVVQQLPDNKATQPSNSWSKLFKPFKFGKNRS